MSKAFTLDTGRAEAEYGGGGGDWLKIKEGMNPMRILTPMEVFPQHYSKVKDGYKGLCLGKEKGCPGCKEGTNVSIKWLCWVLDRTAEQNEIARVQRFGGEVNPKEFLKLAKIPHSVAKQIQDYQNNPEYAFSEAPMPYDITISAKNAGTTDVEYSVQPARQNTPVGDGVLRALEKCTDPVALKERMKEKTAKEHGVATEQQAQPVSGAMTQPPKEGEVKLSNGVNYPKDQIDPNKMGF